ncbi:MAG: DUF4135 domain-containing protein [Candidatus Binatia bacterium]|nr:DUF4135 domain-containing protein [Candidatus Binatia bacterium]
MPRWWRLLGEVTARSSLFVARVARQSAAMSARLGGADSASPLTISLEPWKSDPHDGNRTVVRVAFDARGLWYYKPRALDMETVMDELMGRAREIFPELFPEVLPALHVAGQEGWMQAVGPCRDLPERLHADYFQHAGALLALVRSVGGMDFYRDNLVSDADGWLVPVDSECLFSDETLDGGGPAGILESGILPISSRRLGPRVAGITTGFLDVPDARLREILHRGAPFVEAGFRRCRLALARHVSAWLEEKDLRLRWSSLRRRRLRVGTLGYYTAIERALSPANLVDDSSWRGSLRRHLEEVSPGPRENPAEMEFDVEDLSQLDIPHWTEALAEGGGAVFERLSKRLGCVDERWVDEECRILVASLTGKIAERS